MSPLLEAFCRDLRYAVRGIVRDKAFTASVVLTLSLGIGGTAAVFSVFNAVLLRPFQYRDPEQLAVLWTVNLKQNLRDGSSYLNFQDWRAQSKTFQDMALLYRSDVGTLTGTDEAERIKVGRVSANFFPLLGASPSLGRTFSAREELEAERVVVLSDSLWRSHFRASPDILGSSLEIDGKRSQVIGVMPRGFSFLDEQYHLWEPLTVFQPYGLSWERLRNYRPLDFFRVVGRLKAGVGMEQAQRELDAIAARLEEEHPESNANMGVEVTPLRREMTGDNLPIALWTLLGAGFFVLLIACANAAHLYLAKGVLRSREFALREALGAGKKRLLQLLLAEAMLVSVLAGALGLLVAMGLTQLLIGLAPDDIPKLAEAGLDERVLVFTAAVSILAGLAVGIIPGLRTSGKSCSLVIRGARTASPGPGSRLTRSLLVVSQFVLALVLLLGAGLMVRSFLAAQEAPLGYDPEATLALKMDLPRSSYPQSSDAVAFYEQVLDHLVNLSGVEAAGAIQDFFFARFPDAQITVEGRPAPAAGQPAPRLIITAVSPGFFETMRIPLLGGRQFSQQDGADTPPLAIINQSMADEFWPGQNPIGKRFKRGGPNSTSPWVTVIGSVGDARRQGRDQAAIAQAFTPMTQQPLHNMTLVVRCSSSPDDLIETIRREIRSLDRKAVVFDVATLEGLVGESLSRRRFHTQLLGLFSLLAIMLAIIGVYAVMSADVSSRRREIGIRLVLGSSRARVLRSLLQEGMRLCLVAGVIGIVSGLALTRILQSFLYQVSPADPLTFLLAPALMAAAGVAGCCLPAWRAARVDPATSLREEG